MPLESATQLITATASLLGAIAWPAVLLFVLIKYRTSLSGFIENLGELRVKAGGVEASAQRRRQIEAAVAVGAAAAKSSAEGGEIVDPSAVAEELVASLPDERRQQGIEGSRVLWVDDRPSNNRYERQALEALGVRVAIATSTEEALEQVERQAFDLIISDMGRPPDARAGYTLLDELRRRGNRIPLVIYAGSRARKHVEEARAHGALGATNSAHDLLVIVTRALAQRHRT